MRLYDNAYDSNYEEQKTFYPVWYRDVLEMDALWRVFGAQLDGIQNGIIQAVDNNFIATADEAAITKTEKFLYVTYDGVRTLTERKILVASFFTGSGHIGEKDIKDMVGAFTDGEVTVALIGGMIEVSVTRELSDRFNLSDCTFIVEKRIPAHLRVIFKDVLLPIQFKNENALVFRAFHVHGRFINSGDTRPILLDGQRALDGSWFLDQLFRGIAFDTFSVKTSFSTQVCLRAPFLEFSPTPIFNAALNRFESFWATVGVRNKSLFEPRSVRFNLRAKQAYSFSGSVTIDSLYELDGAVLLDGSKKLNAQISKEAI